jgi:histidinol-phosphate aminotransferase
MNESVDGLPAGFVKNALKEIGPQFLAAYPEYNELKKKVAVHNGLQPGNISLSNGSDAAIKYIFDAYVSPGDKVLLTDPTFAMYPVYCAMFNAEPVMAKYKSDLTFPKDDFREKISSGIRLAVIVNPNSPAGSVVAPDVLLSIIEKAADNDVLIIVDEAYFYFYPHSVITQVEKYSNLIVLRTFSKLCGAAATRLGYAAASPKIIEDLRKVKPTYDVNGFAVLVGEKIMDSPDIIRDLVRSTDDGKKYLVEELSREGIEHSEGQANFVLIKCDERVEEVLKKLAEKNILVNGKFKQDFLKDYIRVTVGSRPAMKRFWDSFIGIWKAWEE